MLPLVDRSFDELAAANREGGGAELGANAARFRMRLVGPVPPGCL